MPKQDKYLKGFGIQQGSYLNGYYLADISIGHDMIRRYREYQYPTILTWKIYDQTANGDKLIQDLSTFLDGERVIYSEYGNPYSCHFGTLSVSERTSDTIVFTSRGVCHRI